MVGSARKKRNFPETDTAPPADSGHKDAIDALRQLKKAGATVTWDGRESRVAFEAVPAGVDEAVERADQASLDAYRKAAAKIDAYFAAELPEFPPAAQTQGERLLKDLGVEVLMPSNAAEAAAHVQDLLALSSRFGLALDIETPARLVGKRPALRTRQGAS